MQFLLVSLALFALGGLAAALASALAPGGKRLASRVGGLTAAAASVIGLVPVITMLSATLRGSHEPLFLTAGKLPMGEFAIRLDALSAVFLAPALILIGIAAVYGMGGGDGSQGGYAEEIAPAPGEICAIGGRHAHPGAHWLCYNLMAGGMVLALVAADAFLFLLSWEVMSVAPFFLVSMNDDSAPTRGAAWIYLMAAHLGALVLLGFFALLSAKSGGSLSFTAFAAGAGTLEGGLAGGAGLLFLLAVIGFGAKAGIMPLHVWMPETYPAAPSHVAAVMSGAMSKMGVYGIIRALTFLGQGEAWWGYLLIAAGAFGGFTGILQAMVQPGVKRALAFSSVENIGIICMALGMGLFCLQNGLAAPAGLFMVGALVHMINHALTKGLLFLTAGCVLHGAGTGTLRLLGGLQKRLPFVGICFLLGCASISALPPFNGFAGEFLLYLGMLFGGAGAAQGVAQSVGLEHSFMFWFGIFVLSGIGGFTLLCFARLYGIIFLGEARSPLAAGAGQPARAETAAIAALALLCLFSSLASPTIAAGCRAAAVPVTASFAPQHPVLAAAPPARESRVSRMIVQTPEAPHLSLFGRRSSSAFMLLHKVNSVFLLGIVAVLAAVLLRRRLLRGKPIGSSPTWDCGYGNPTARMQYTGGSFSQPAAWFMRTLLRQKTSLPAIDGYFPARARARLDSPDWMKERFDALFRAVKRLADWCKHLQHGHINAYILYILVTLVTLLAWQVR